MKHRGNKTIDTTVLLTALVASSVAILDPQLWLIPLALLLVTVAFLRGGAASSASLLLALLTLSWAAALRFVGWPLVILWPLAAYALLAWRLPHLRPQEESFRRGRLSLGWITAFALGSTAGLLGWLFLLEPDLDRYREFLPDLPVPLLLLGALLFPIANALVEESIYRGVLQKGLEVQLGWLPAVILQAAAFGLLHWRGFPSGPVGAILAGSWGLGLGILRRWTGGLLTPVVAHIAADIVIFACVFATG